jgi:hypothetical protein
MSQVIIKGQTIYGVPQVITDGLVLYLDAANPKSYSGSGTTCYDLSGYNTNATLVNGVSYTSANAGGLVFDGTNDATLLPASALWNVGNSNFTIEFWFKRTGTSQTYGRYFQLTNGDTFSAFSLSVKGTNQDQLSFSMASINGSWNVLNDVVIGTLLPGRFNHVVISRIGTSFYLYLNTVQSLITTSAASLYYASGGVPIIGGQSIGTTRSLAGIIPVFKFYKGKGLTLTEATQNYNALKSRFGL